MDMKIIFASIVAVSIFLTASPTFGQFQNLSGIPMVNFICYNPEPLFDIMKDIKTNSPTAGRAKAESYIESNECWHLGPTPVEIVSILQEEFDPKGKLWAVVAVKPHEITGFEKRTQRFAVVDAAAARAYITRHSL